MKNLNFLSNLCGLGRASQSSDVGSRCRVVADLLPSFCRVNMLKLVSVLVLILTIGSGNVWGAEEVYKETIFNSTNNSAGHNQYNASWTNTTNGFQVDLVNASNNNNGWDYIKIGNKNNAYTGTITTHSAIDDKITKVRINIGGIQSTYVTSITLYTSPNNSTWTSRGTFTKSTGWQTVSISAGNQAANLYYKIEVVTTSSGSGSNGRLQINGIEYYHDAASGGTVATPSFNNGTGTYNNNVSVTISCATDGAAIHYTTSGTAPTCSTGTTGTSVTISSTGTVLKAIACKDGSTDSEVATATYTLKCATPTGLTTGTYVGTQTITLATATVGASIYYTTNGSTPTSSSTLYTTPFNVSSTSTIKAIAIKSNYGNSDVASATYTITPAYVVTWKNQGTTVTTTNVASGSKPVFPDMSGESGCQTYTYFYGWAEDTWSGEVTSPGTSSTVKVYKSASEMPEVDGDVTYHAVWSDTEPGWAPAASISVGDVVLLVNASGGTTYELGGISTTSTKYGLLHEYDTDPDETYPLTVGLGYNSENYSFKNGSDYLYWGSGNSLNKNTTLSTNTSWTVSINAETKVATIRNVSDASRYLQYNAGSRFACYTNSCADPMLLKKSASGKCVTSCCNQLGTINGSVSSYTQTSVTLQWDKLSNVAAGTPYTVTASGGSVGAIDLSGAKATCTVTGLSCGTAYTFSITAHGTTGYCDKTQSGIAQTTSSYSVSYTVTNGTKTSGDATTCGPLTAVFSANTGYHLPDKAAITVTGASDFSWTKATGTLNITAIQITGNISISFTCPADACTDAFSLHTGTKGGGDWLYNKCFSDVDWGAADDAIWTGEFPSTNECYVGYAGGDSYHGAYWAVGGIKTYNIPNGRTLGWNGSDYYSDYPATAIGTFHIYKNSTDANYYLRFKPTTYVLRTGSDGTSWTSRDMTVSGVNANYYESEFITLTSTMISENAYVDLKANNANGHVWCNFSNSRTASGNVKVKNSASTFRATDLQAADNGSYGKFQIDITQDVDNWKLAFVPYYRITYNANGGSGSTSASSYVEVGSSAAAASNGFTAPTGKQFSHWNTDSGDGGTSYNPAASVTLTGNVVLYAIWEDINYTVTVNQSPSVGAATTGQTSSAHYGGTINLTTTIPDGYRFVNWTTSDGFSITNNTSATTASFTMPAKDVTVTANFQQTHTVTWKVTGSADNEEIYDHGDALVLPSDPSSPTACSEKKFVGWKEGAIDGSTDVRPTMIDPSSPGTVTADKTYYAVFADDNSGSVTITASCMPTTGSDSYANRTWSATGTDGTEFTGSTYNFKRGNSDYFQFKNEGSPFYNTTPTPHPITKIEMVKYSGTDRSWTPRVSATAVQSTSSATGGTNLTAKGVTTSGQTWELDEADGYLYVYLGVAGGATNIEYIKIYYGSSSGYVTECSSCTTPSNLAVSDITSSGATVTWDGVSQTQQVGGSGTGYKVAWNTSNSVPSPLTASNSADVANGTNTYDITGLTAATQYYVFVQSKCDDSWSSSENFYTNAKITYAANGGTGDPMPAKEVVYNAASTVVDACTFTAPSGKVFNGWVSNTAVHVNGGGSTTTAVPAGATINNLTAAITLTAQWRDLAVYHVTFSADNGTVAGGASQDVLEGGTLTFPNVTSTTCGTFSGWVEAAYDNTAAPSGATYHAVGDELAADPSMDGKTYYAVYHVAMGAPTTTTDVLVYSDFNATGSSYVATNNLRKSSAAVYEAVTAQLYSGAFNFNKISDARGIVTPTSGGVFKSITLTTNTNHSATRKVYVYGSSSYTAAYADPAAFKDNSSVRGTLLATLEGATKTYSTSTDDYEYIAIFADGAAYMDQIDITWYGAPMKYQTSPACSPVVSLTSSFSSFTYVYGSGPSASQSFTVSGANLGANLVVTAPANYEVCKTSGGTYTSSVSYTPSDGTVTDQTVYIRLAGGLNVGTYNYAAASGVSAASTGATTRTAALNGSVTKAAGAIAFTDFNAVDHYEAEMAAGAASVDVTLTVSVTGDGAVSYSRTPAAGSSAVPATTPTTTLHVTTVGTWTVTANLAAGTNYTSASTNCQVVVYYADRFYDNLHGNSTIVKRNDVGEDHYTIPSLSDESRQTSGTCSQTHYHFMGWVPEAALGSLTDDASYTAVMITSGTQAASGTNYYAVWAEE